MLGFVARRSVSGEQKEVEQGHLCIASKLTDSDIKRVGFTDRRVQSRWGRKNFILLVKLVACQVPSRALKFRVYSELPTSVNVIVSKIVGYRTYQTILIRLFFTFLSRPSQDAGNLKQHPAWCLVFHHPLRTST